MLKVDLQLFYNTKNKKQKMPQGAVDNFVSKTSYGNGNTPTYVNYTNNYSGTLASTDPRFKAPSTKNTGLLPKTDYNWNTFIGGTNAQLSAMQYAGLAPKNNGQKTAPNINGNPGLKGVPGGTNWSAYIQNQFDKAMKGFGGIGGSYGGGGLSHIGPFQASDAYNQAMAYTNSLLEKLNNGRTSYSDKVDAMMSKIENRAAFSYDMDKDPMFQSYLSSMMDKGKLAMMDTIGQASALTGGYGSTYATGAANGAYNNYISEAYDNVKDYYGMALDAYNTETSNLYNQLGMYRDADESEYSRLYNAYNANFAMANDMYGKEYSNYWDTANYNLGVDQYNSDLAYKYANLNADIAYRNASLQQNAMSDYYNFMLKGMNGSSGSGSDGGSGSGSDGVRKNFLTETNHGDTVNMLSDLYFKFGSALDSNDPNAPNTEYDNAMEALYNANYDTDLLHSAITNKNNGFQYSYTEDKGKWYKASDNRYVITLPSGQVVSATKDEWKKYKEKYNLVEQKK